MVVIDILLAGAVTYAALSSERGVLIALVAACVCLVCWQVAVFLRARRGALALGIERNIRLPHYLQAGVQACHYLYLGLYYPAVQEHLPLIAIQIVVFYLLQWSRGRNWRAGFGPLPVVGSINLFLWFFVGQLLLVAGALASREFVRPVFPHFQSGGVQATCHYLQQIFFATTGARAGTLLGRGWPLFNVFHISVVAGALASREFLGRN